MNDSDGSPTAREDPEVVAVGSAVEDRVYALTNLPEPDGGAFVREETTAVGGVAANVAAGLAQLGRETAVVSRVGDDAAADRILADLRERGIDAERVRRGDPDEATSYSLILRDPEGERMIVAGGESVPNLRLTDADCECLRRADLAFTSAYAPDPVTSALVDLACAAADSSDSESGHSESSGSESSDSFPPLVFDLAGPLSELEDRATRPGTIDDLLPVCDLFVAGEVSARSYLGVGPREAVETLRARGVSRAAITKGEAGAFLLDEDGESHEIPSFDVPVADTTGAGDAFTAGLAHAWLLGNRSPAAAGRFAAATAALNCTAENARGGLPTADEVEAFLDGR
ncbi:carbohydrate kinase family protein [Halorussus litoreus]|uniref:carbohydrate kinase family protein n=1 Tax=Halorussus litoreus TaxID=1710536 RepID=UPI000E23FA94|nr:carbohydrate kinase family protein [Halorussus litoreus]